MVAAEVRSLAKRSADAAQEIKKLIGDSVGKVEAGSALVQQAGKTMNDIVSSIRHVTDIMGEISAASADQTAGIERVGMAIAEMNQVTHQNAALVDQAAAAAKSLQDQAQQLEEVVSTFKISDSNGIWPCGQRCRSVCHLSTLGSNKINSTSASKASDIGRCKKIIALPSPIEMALRNCASASGPRIVPTSTGAVGKLKRRMISPNTPIAYNKYKSKALWRMP